MSLRSRTPKERAARKQAREERAADRARLPIGPFLPVPVEPELPPPRARSIVDDLVLIGEPRAVTTERTMGPALDKRRAVRSPTYIAWVKEQPCAFPTTERHDLAPGHLGGDPHHEPTTGSNGVQLDALLVSTCRIAHALCDAAFGWTPEEKQAAAHRTWTRFWRLASREMKVAVLKEMIACL